MTQIINLRTARKHAARSAKRKEADANSVRHGRTRAERALDKVQAEKTRKHLDAHKRERGE